MMFTALCLIAYAAGSLNASILVLKLKKKDPRTLFSKNAGTTNVYRILGLKWAGFVLMTDVGKAFLIAATASRFLSAPAALWVGFFLLLGNRFPCFHGFKGGKGVAHFIGFSLFFTPLFTVLSLAGWCAGYLFFRQAFAGSLVLVAILVIGLVRTSGTDFMGIAGVLACMGCIIINHRNNLLALVSKNPCMDISEKMDDTP
ncbi:glycerol-3-phosphate acyltransferase [Desulfobacter hydrogenophilus]|uniref:Glycerol-3-phosphate acyltransferase n=2 Tax=Desulfobacter hydrogenophilus TaxID=2291 RepID=A0A328FE20_9BACT|nr:glycerol-3-phosphate acyltransferase [Desulfobacter hydrogenophilus]NDY72584.1 glycerol-3-phosphate acyltransferase [Desulfobacter hydrogenophilus]QBH15572.1 glycerol-3-phosphate acyltransferase [Desulfobacter hydrogenophilus]RAM01297.1 glycerol-3-phosphate acyltransferase [Desulfobacter hydrogenophilus]